MAEIMHSNQETVCSTLKQCVYISGVSDNLGDEDYKIVASMLMTGTYKRLTLVDLMEAFKLYSEGVLNVKEKYIFSYKLVGDVLKEWKDYVRCSRMKLEPMIALPEVKDKPEDQWNVYIKLIRMGDMPFGLTWSDVYEYGTANEYMEKPTKEEGNDLKRLIMKEEQPKNQKEFNKLCYKYWCIRWAEQEIRKSGDTPNYSMAIDL